MYKHVYFLLLISLGGFASFDLVNRDTNPSHSDPPQEATTPSDSILQVSEEQTPERIRLTFVGDLMCHQEQFQRAFGEDGYDFGPSFQWVAPYLKKADFCFGNLETTFSGTESWRRISGYPAFNTPDAFASALADAGFDMVFMANNHTLDHGEHGLSRSLEVLQKNGIRQAGVKRVDEERSPFAMLETKGIRIAVLAYTALSNASLNDRDSLSLYYLDPTQLPRHITYARTLGADLVIVHFHYGQEYLQRPTALQLEAVKAAVRAGADLIVGDHPHVLQPLNTFQSGQTHIDQTLAAYSLGNFLSNQQGSRTRAGLMLTVEIERNPPGEGKPFKLAKVEVVPTAVILPQDGQHAIVPTHVAAELKPVPRLAFEARNALMLSEYQLKILRQTERNTRELIKLRDMDVIWDRGY